MNRGEITLEYVKILIWPLFGLMVFLLFRGEISGLLEGEFEADVLGVKVKSSQQGNLAELKQKEEQLEQNITDLTNQLSDQKNINQALLEQIEKLEKAIGASRDHGAVQTSEEWSDLKNRSKTLEKESQNLFQKMEQNIEVSQKILQKDKFQKAQALETTLFDQILADQYQDAIRTCQKITAIFPGFHNAYEIQRLLERSKDELEHEDPAVRDQNKKRIFSEMLKKYSWGMPDSVKAKLKERGG